MRARPAPGRAISRPLARGPPCIVHRPLELSGGPGDGAFPEPSGHRRAAAEHAGSARCIVSSQPEEPRRREIIARLTRCAPGRPWPSRPCRRPRCGLRAELGAWPDLKENVLHYTLPRGSSGRRQGQSPTTSGSPVDARLPGAPDEPAPRPPGGGEPLPRPGSCGAAHQVFSGPASGSSAWSH